MKFSILIHLATSCCSLLAFSHFSFFLFCNFIPYRVRACCSHHVTRSIHFISLICWLIPLTLFCIYFSSIPCQGEFFVPILCPFSCYTADSSETSEEFHSEVTYEWDDPYRIRFTDKLSTKWKKIDIFVCVLRMLFLLTSKSCHFVDINSNIFK